MNLMGKILTGFILLMSIVFLVLAVMVGASHRNWKEVAAENKTQAEFYMKLLNSAKEESSQKLRSLELEKVVRQQQLQQLFAQLEIEKNNRDVALKSLSDEKVINAELSTALNRSESRLANQDTEVENLKQSNKRLVDEIALKRTEVVALTNEINQTMAKLQVLESRAQDMSSQLANAQKVLKTVGKTIDSPTYDIPEKVEGVVVQVEKTADAELLVISLGTDDGIRTGHTMDIYRGNRFIGKAVVSRSDANQSLLKVTPEYRQTAVREGDHVTTKL